VPRRLTPPEPPLADDAVTLEPLGPQHVPALAALIDDDVKRYTMVPSTPDDDFVSSWVARYEAAWRDATRAGFAIRAADGIAGFAAIVRLELEAAQGEIGYFVGAPFRGRGIATSCVRLLTAWGHGPLALERLELRIDATNRGSEVVAERCGYRLEGVLRSTYFKEGMRADLGIWSRLRSDERSRVGA
jgi:RimJ/RimL family protein N-acetyltransferase